MASYIVIGYDTTSPAIEIFAPLYTTNEIVTVITVEANESVSSYQEFYAIDNSGTRHDYTFTQEDHDTYVGKIRFNTVPLGLITLYARLKDEVENISDVAMATMEVKEHNQLLKMETRFSARGVAVVHGSHSTTSAGVRDAEIKVDKKSMDTVVSDKSGRIDSTIQERKG